MSASSTVRPSDLETIFDVTTMMSPSANAVPAALAASAINAARSAPLAISGRPATPKICKPLTG